LAATGVGVIVCTHHNLTYPSSVRDLQKGERYVSLTSLTISNHRRLRYVNINYLFFSTLQHSDEVLVLNISSTLDVPRGV
ncbi:uncharacterized protein F5891DRAFT_943086, partial [Suillus fuscotomentosus]